MIHSRKFHTNTCLIDMQTILVTGGTGLVGQGIRLALERTKNDGKQANENWIFLSSKDCNLLYLLK